MEKDQEILWEEVKIGILRNIVDDTARKLREGGMSEPQIEPLLEETRLKVLALFPDKEHVYDLIYTPRFRRIIQETYG